MSSRGTLFLEIPRSKRNEPMVEKQYRWPSPDLDEIEQDHEAPLRRRELLQLAALLGRATSSLGGLPIHVRIDLSTGLHSLERYLAHERFRGR
jgi:hypothetical protein